MSERNAARERIENMVDHLHEAVLDEIDHMPITDEIRITVLVRRPLGSHETTIAIMVADPPEAKAFDDALACAVRRYG